jgi:hypothetical protein
MKAIWPVLFAASILSLAGCSSQTGGEPSPVTQSPASSTSSNPAAPKVANPLDVSAFLADPCKLVPQVTLSGLGFSNPGTVHDKNQSPAGPDCGWIDPNAARNMTVILQTNNRDSGIGGLAGIYTGRDTGQLLLVEPAPDVDGYPAVFSDRQDRRPRGACNLVVGIEDDLVFSVGNQGYEGAQDSCDAARQVAGAVVKTLKES